MTSTMCMMLPRHGAVPFSFHHISFLFNVICCRCNLLSCKTSRPSMIPPYPPLFPVSLLRTLRSPRAFDLRTAKLYAQLPAPQVVVWQQTEDRKELLRDEACLANR